jgi:hypothetical protein
VIRCGNFTLEHRSLQSGCSLSNPHEEGCDYTTEWVLRWDYFEWGWRSRELLLCDMHRKQLAGLLTSDYDDTSRYYAILRSILQQPCARAEAYPTVGQEDVWQVFISGPGPTIASAFTCTARCSVRERDVVTVAVLAYLQAWMRRTFPDMALPKFAITVHLDDRPPPVPR